MKDFIKIDDSSQTARLNELMELAGLETKAGFKPNQRRDASGKWTSKPDTFVSLGKPMSVREKNRKKFAEADEKTRRQMAMEMSPWEFEAMIRGQEFESIGAFKDGKMIAFADGINDTVGFPDDFDMSLLEGALVTHNHPKGGGCFILSPQDVFMHIVTKAAVTRSFQGDRFSEVVQTGDILEEFFNGDDNWAWSRWSEIEAGINQEMRQLYQNDIDWQLAALEGETEFNVMASRYFNGVVEFDAEPFNSGIMFKYGTR